MIVCGQVKIDCVSWRSKEKSEGRHKKIALYRGKIQVGSKTEAVGEIDIKVDRQADSRVCRQSQRERESKIYRIAWA